MAIVNGRGLYQDSIADEGRQLQTNCEEMRNPPLFGVK